MSANEGRRHLDAEPVTPIRPDSTTRAASLGDALRTLLDYEEPVVLGAGCGVSPMPTPPEPAPAGAGHTFPPKHGMETGAFPKCVGCGAGYGSIAARAACKAAAPAGDPAFGALVTATEKAAVELWKAKWRHCRAEVSRAETAYAPARASVEGAYDAKVRERDEANATIWHIHKLKVAGCVCVYCERHRAALGSPAGHDKP